MTFDDGSKKSDQDFDLHHDKDGVMKYQTKYANQTSQPYQCRSAFMHI